MDEKVTVSNAAATVWVFLDQFICSKVTSLPWSILRAR